MQSEADSAPSIVEEFPGPPLYYKDYYSKLTAPPIPTVNPYLRAYNGNFAHIHENAAHYDSEKDYKVEFKRSLEDIMTSSAQIISNKHLTTGNASGIIEQNVLDLRNKLANIHQLLDEYRMHEARETLIKEMQSQLEDSCKLEEALSRTIEEVRALLPPASK